METLNQSNIRKAAQQEIVPIPDWLEVGKYAFAPQFGNVKVLSILGNLANCLSLGNTVQIAIKDLTPSTIEVNSIDLSSITHGTYNEIASEWFDELNGIKIFSGQPSNCSTLPSALHPSVKQALKSTGIHQFYSHQLEAWEELNQGNSICITTPTASGKSNSFIPFAFHKALVNKGTSLLIYPLKALANDQFDKLIALNEALPINDRLLIVNCTGDVSSETRKGYFQGSRTPDIIVISPDVLHYQLYYSNKAKLLLWQDFLSRLVMVVCDESHVMTSSFGIHVCNVFRRLRLACNNVGHPPTPLSWVISTATISNPLELASLFSGILEEKISLINQSGAKSQEKTLLIFKPQTAPNFTCSTLINSLLTYDVKGLAFVNSRRTGKQIFSILSHQNGGQNDKVDLFYGSLNSRQRHQRINQLATGAKKLLITTNCLEAGIDLPELDVVILRGFTSLNSFWQRGGRCGRKSPGLIIFIPDKNNHIDYYYSTQPDKLLSPVEKVKIQPNYPSILSRHLLCASAEGGIKASEVTQYFGEKSDLIAAELLKQNQLYWSYQQVLWLTGYPHKNVSLRGIQNETIQLIDIETKEPIEEMTLDLAHRECFEGAIYVTTSEGKSITWKCQKLDISTKKAELKQGDYHDKRTIPTTELIINPVQNMESPRVINTQVYEGNLRLTLSWGTITTEVSGYKEMELIYSPTCVNRRCTNYGIGQKPGKQICSRCQRKLVEKLESKLVEEIDFMPSLSSGYEAPILKIEVNKELGKAIKNKSEELKKHLLHTYQNLENIPSQLSSVFATNPVYLSLHSLCHLLSKSVPLLFLASHQDVSNLTVERLPINGGNAENTVAYIYDAVHEGCGTTEAILNDWDACVQKALELASNCDCGDLGCPRCLTEHGCPESNQSLSKLLGIWLLEQILNGHKLT